jgi:hypothetical protein
MYSSSEDDDNFEKYKYMTQKSLQSKSSFHTPMSESISAVAVREELNLAIDKAFSINDAD